MASSVFQQLMLDLPLERGEKVCWIWDREKGKTKGAHFSWHCWIATPGMAGIGSVNPLTGYFALGHGGKIVEGNGNSGEAALRELGNALRVIRPK